MEEIIMTHNNDLKETVYLEHFKRHGDKKPVGMVREYINLIYRSLAVSCSVGTLLVWKDVKNMLKRLESVER